MQSVYSIRGILESAILVIAMFLCMTDWSDAGIDRLAADNTRPAAGQAPDTEPSEMTGERIPEQSLSEKDRAFLKQALEGGTAEVQEAKLAQQKAVSKGVKDAATHLERDHTKANDELKRIASGNGITIAENPPAERQQLYQRLQSLSGKQFEDVYVRAGIDAHRRTIALFEQTESETHNPAIKTFAGSTLPTLKDHLAMMQAIDGK